MNLKIIFLVLIFAFFGCPETVSAAESGGTVYLQPWLVGIIAVAVFLVLAFVFLLFNHYVCEKFYDYDEDMIEDVNGGEPRSSYLKGLSVNEYVEEPENHYVNNSFKPDDVEVTQL